jgi:hypothetical protein
MYVWSKKIVGGLLLAFAILLGVSVAVGSGTALGHLTSPTTLWILLNYCGLVIWVFIWMIDQATVRGKPVWPWLLPFLLAPLPTLLIYILVLQRRIA